MAFINRRIYDRGRRIEDCSPLAGMMIMVIYELIFGCALGCIIGFIVGRAIL
jgi:NhaP-type Na+/H+ or K+/H+ antiporter